MCADRVAPASGTGSTVKVDDISVYYDDRGSGHPVVLVHGGIMDHQSWGNQIPELAKHFRIISPDTRAHGRSTDSDKPLTYDLFASDVVGLLVELGIAKASFVGFSDGGCVGLLLAAKYPEMVDKVVLIGTPHDTSNYQEGTAELFATITPEQFYGMVGEDSAFGEVVKKAEVVYPSAQAWQNFWVKLVNGLWSREPKIELASLSSITAPTLLLHAANEQFFDRRHSEDLAATIPNATLGTVPGATHCSPQENPDAVNAAVIGFLSRG